MRPRWLFFLCTELFAIAFCSFPNRTSTQIRCFKGRFDRPAQKIVLGAVSRSGILGCSLTFFSPREGQLDQEPRLEASVFSKNLGCFFIDNPPGIRCVCEDDFKGPCNTPNWFAKTLRQYAAKDDKRAKLMRQADDLARHAMALHSDGVRVYKIQEDVFGDVAAGAVTVACLVIIFILVTCWI